LRISKFYADDFLSGFNQLNFRLPKQFTKATDHIEEQIELVKKIEKAGFALEKGQLGERLVRTQFGYHIVKVDDKRTVPDFIRTVPDFIAFTDDIIKNAKVKFYIPIHNPFEAVKE